MTCGSTTQLDGFGRSPTISETVTGADDEDNTTGVVARRIREGELRRLRASQRHARRRSVCEWLERARAVESDIDDLRLESRPSATTCFMCRRVPG